MSKYFFLIISIFLFGLNASPNCENAVCGGLRDIQCCEGYTCNLDGNNIDADGHCAHNLNGCLGAFCGGIAGVECCEGFECNNSNQADASGECQKIFRITQECVAENFPCNEKKPCCDSLECKTMFKIFIMKWNFCKKP